MAFGGAACVHQALELKARDDVLVLPAAVLGIVVMVPYGRLRKSDDGSGQIPFGPFLAVAAPFMYLWGETLFDWYMFFVFGEIVH